MRYKIRTFAGHKHPAEHLKFGDHVGETQVRGESERSVMTERLRSYIYAGMISRADVFDRNMTRVEQITD